MLYNYGIYKSKEFPKPKISLLLHLELSATPATCQWYKKFQLGTFCKQEIETRYEHNLECNLDKADGLIECCLQGPLLKQTCPAITDVSYEQYCQSVSSVIFNLWRFFQEGNFTFAMDNRVTDHTRT